jgi:uncharacterized protein (DUF433 family)
LRERIDCSKQSVRDSNSSQDTHAWDGGVLNSACHGRPCIHGHRIWVSLIVDLLADGMTTEQIIEQYSGLEPDDVRACLVYAAEMTRERIVVTNRSDI